jgi:hypothetical protein
VYKIDVMDGFAAAPKSWPLVAWAGRWLLGEKSSAVQGDTLGDADSYRYCVAFASGECRQNSAAGDVYVSVPAASFVTQCRTGQMTVNTPCVSRAPATDSAVVEWDLTTVQPFAQRWRALSHALTNFGTAQGYSGVSTDPDGRFGFAAAWWVNGVRSGIIQLRLPPWPGQDNVNRSEWQWRTVSMSPKRGYPKGTVEFGYIDRLSGTDVYCTARQDKCLAALSPTDISPYVFASEAAALARLPATVKIPLIPDRLGLYREQWCVDDSRSDCVYGPWHIVE